MGCGSSKATATADALETPPPANGFKPSGRTPQSAADPHSSLPPEAQPSKILSSPKAGSGGLDASLGQIAAPAGTQPPQPAAVHGAVAAEQIQMAILPSQPSQPAGADAAAAAQAAAAAAAASAAAAAPAADAGAGASAAAADAEKHQEMITGVLEKRGELGTPGQLRWVERYVVLCEGELTYYKTQADYELGKQPRKNNRVRLNQYCVCAGEPAETLLIDKSREGRNAANDVDWARGFFLRPLPFAGMPQRTWEFRAVEVQDLKDWLDVFTEQGCLSEAGYAALVAAPHRAAELLGADHPVIASGAAYVPPPTPEVMVSRAVAAHGAAAAASASGAASPDAAARSVSPGGSDSSSAASPGAPAVALAAAGVPINTAEPSGAASPAAGAPIVATAAAAAAAAGAVLPPDLPPAAFSDPAAVLAAHTAPLPAAPTRPYDAAALVLTPAVVADLSDPATDAEDPRFFAGYIEKRGEQAFAGYKKRWVALKRGFMMYYADQAARKRGAKPNHGNHIPLSAYRLVLPALTQSIKLEPLVKGKDAGSRVWELRLISKHAADREEWVAALCNHGASRTALPHGRASAVDPAYAAAAKARASVAVSTGTRTPASPSSPGGAGAAGGEGASTVAPNGYDYTTRPEVWEVCRTEDGQLFFYHFPTGQSQWELPSSDSLAESELAAAAAAAAAGAGGEGAAAAGAGATSPIGGSGAGAVPSPVSPASPRETVPSNPAAAAADAAAPAAAAAAGGAAFRVGELEKGKASKGGVFSADKVVFKRRFFELSGGVLNQYETEEAYRKGASVATADATRVRDYVLLEALEIAKAGPSLAHTATTVAKGDEGRTLTLQAADGKGGVLMLRAPDRETRDDWGRALFAAGAARPALPTE